MPDIETKAFTYAQIDVNVSNQYDSLVLEKIVRI